MRYVREECGQIDVLNTLLRRGNVDSVGAT